MAKQVGVFIRVMYILSQTALVGKHIDY